MDTKNYSDDNDNIVHPNLPIYDESILNQEIPGDIKIYGSEFSQIIEISLLAGESLIAEPSVMMHAEGGIEAEVQTGGMGKAMKRCCASEALFRLRWQNVSMEPKNLALTPTFPARIIPIDLAIYSGMTIKPGTFMASIGTCNIEIRLIRSLSRGFFGSHGFILESLHGNGIAFIACGGTILAKRLKKDEVLMVESSSLVAFEKTVDYKIKRVGSLATMCCGGMGIVNTKLKGPGLVMVQSMPKEKFQRAATQI